MYLRGVCVSGDQTIKSSPASPTIPLEIDIKDVVSDLSAIFTLYFEARKAAGGAGSITVFRTARSTWMCS